MSGFGTDYEEGLTLTAKHSTIRPKAIWRRWSLASGYGTDSSPALGVPDEVGLAYGSSLVDSSLCFNQSSRSLVSRSD